MTTPQNYKVVPSRIGEDVGEELRRSANIIARYHDANRDTMPDNVSAALRREMDRLRRLAHQVEPDEPEDETDTNTKP